MTRHARERAPRWRLPRAATAGTALVCFFLTSGGETYEAVGRVGEDLVVPASEKAAMQAEHARNQAFWQGHGIDISNVELQLVERKQGVICGRDIVYSDGRKSLGHFCPKETTVLIPASILVDVPNIMQGEHQQTEVTEQELAELDHIENAGRDFVVSHEDGHAAQHAMGLPHVGRKAELEADCYAGGVLADRARDERYANSLYAFVGYLANSSDQSAPQRIHKL